MAKKIDINENKSHKVSEVVCLSCLKRWIAVRPVETRLKELECPYCGTQGYAIETGEDIDNDDIPELKKV